MAVSAGYVYGNCIFCELIYVKFLGFSRKNLPSVMVMSAICIIFAATKNEGDGFVTCM